MTRNEARDPGGARRRTRQRAVAASLAATTLALASAAGASGFLNPRLADPHGHPALSNPYALYFNPAALGGIQGTQLVIDGTLAFRTVEYNRRASELSPRSPGSALSNPTYVDANTGPAHAANVLALPFVAASSDFGTRHFFAGIGTYMPFGGSVEFDQRPEFQRPKLVGNPDARGAIDGSQRWAVISGSQLAIYNTLALGYRLPEHGLSFGIGTSLVVSRIEHLQARNPDGSDETSTEGRALLQVSGVELALALGVYWEAIPAKKLTLGASYQIRPAFGGMRLSGTLRQQYADEIKRSVDLLQTYPDVMRAGLAARPWGKELEIRLDAEYVTWSVMRRQCIVDRGMQCSIGANGQEQSSSAGQVILAIPRNWHNTAAVRAGAGYFVDEGTEIYGGLGYDMTAVPKRTLEANYPDAPKIIASVGGRRQFSPLLALGVSYTLVQYFAETTHPQSLNSLAGASRVPNEGGEYHSRVMFFNLNATLSF